MESTLNGLLLTDDQVLLLLGPEAIRRILLAQSFGALAFGELL